MIVDILDFIDGIEEEVKGINYEISREINVSTQFHNT